MKNQAKSKSYKELKQDYHRLEKLLRKVIRKRDREKSIIQTARLNKKIELLRKKVSEIKKTIREIDRKYSKPAFFDRLDKKDVLNLESAGKNKLGPDGSLLLSNNDQKSITKKNLDDLVNKTPKHDADGKLFLSSSKINKLITTNSGVFSGE
jgi:hypothetical protein